MDFNGIKEAAITQFNTALDRVAQKHGTYMYIPLLSEPPCIYYVRHTY